jgi:hypothetical protein
MTAQSQCPMRVRVHYALFVKNVFAKRGGSILPSVYTTPSNGGGGENTKGGNMRPWTKTGGKR